MGVRLATQTVLILHFAIRQDEGSLALQIFLQGLHTAIGSVEAADASEIIRSRCKTG